MSLNTWSNLQYFEAMSPKELIDQIKAIDVPVSDCQFVVQGSRFVVFFRTNAQIVKVKKQTILKKQEVTNVSSEGL